MSDLEKEKFLPIGLGKEAEPKETLPAIEVDNQVIWVNPDFPHAPFALEKGKPTKLGLFLTPEKPEKSFPLKIMEGHGRSGLVGKVIFKDAEDRLYRDLDLKGMGHILCGEVRKVKKSDTRGVDTIEGIFDKKSALWAKAMAEKFLAVGIRTERYLALIQLKEIVDENREKISIDEAQKRGMIPGKIIPVLALRAFGTKYRISDILFNNKKTLVEDARRMVSQELRVKDKDFSLEYYLDWFAETLGENVGLMHKNEWYHSYLTAHNITLDCRIVDLDSADSFHLMSRLEKEYKMENDWRDARQNLKGFFRLLGHEKTSLEKASLDKFDKAYEKTLGYKPSFLKESFITE